jgi:hypothetical protein
MSLVGSLEDLGLADILQIVGLAQKSGVLVLRGEEGEGRIVFQGGLIHAATVKGEPADPPPAARAPGRARAPLPEGAGKQAEEALRRELVERAVARMFEWRSGEFSFEVRDDLDPADAQRALEAGVSAQYLAMEATRRGDERRAGLREPDPGPVHGEGAAPGAALEALVDAVLERVDARGADPRAPGEHAPGRRAVDPDAGRAACERVVVVDPDLAALEWAKATLAELFERVHIFQGAEAGIARIRQYLSRGEVPAVVLSAQAPMDPLSGIDTLAELLRRLRAQAPRMPLLVLAEAGGPAPRAGRFADGVIARPSARVLADPKGAERAAAAAGALRARLAPFARRAGSAAGADPPEAETPGES